MRCIFMGNRQTVPKLFEIDRKWPGDNFSYPKYNVILKNEWEKTI